MNEIWKDIEGYNGRYKISSFGRVMSMWQSNQYKTHIGKPKIVKPAEHRQGYLYVYLTNNGEKTKHYVHRLVAEAFIPNPDNLPQVNHKSEVKTENFVENLEWCDGKYNNNYGSRLEKIANKHKGKPLTEEHKQKISIANSGSNNCMYGKPSWNRGQKGLQVAWNKGVPCSEETKSKISQAKKKLAS